jgi:hypothetical protein
MSDWIHLDVEKILQETDKAFLCLIDGEQHWIPKSQVSDPDDYYAGDKDCCISVTEWLAKEKGLS